MLAIFPAALALTALLGLVGQAERSVQTVVDVLEPLVSEQTLGTVRPVLEDLAGSETAGWALVVGLVLALWSASSYIGAFGRAMNRIYEIGEGRPWWKLRPIMLLITLIAVVLVAVVLLMLIVSGPLAKSIGDVVGLGDESVQVWGIVKWPIILLVVIVVVALLYYTTPNVQQPKFRWISVGATVAIVIWIVASVGFAFYVANFSSYNKTYGSLAGVVVTLIFLWLTNVALLLGAEIDSELERGRQLQAGHGGRARAAAAGAGYSQHREGRRAGGQGRRRRARDPPGGREIEGHHRKAKEIIMKKLLFLVAIAAGYVLGARAGRQRYEQIKQMFVKVKDDPRVQSAAHSAADTARQQAPVVKDKITAAASTAADKVRPSSSSADDELLEQARPRQHRAPGQPLPAGPPALRNLNQHVAERARPAPGRR